MKRSILIIFCLAFGLAASSYAQEVLPHPERRWTPKAGQPDGINKL